MVKLNCNGAHRSTKKVVGYDSLLRDVYGRWIKGYYKKLGDYDVLLVEMWGMYLGIVMTQRHGVS